MRLTRLLPLILLTPLAAGCAAVPAAVIASDSTAFGTAFETLRIVRLPDEVAPIRVTLPGALPDGLAQGRPVIVASYGLTILQARHYPVLIQGGGAPRVIRLRANFTGVSDANFQLIADEARADLLARLEEAGFRPASAEDAAQLPAPRIAEGRLDGELGVVTSSEYSAWRTLGATGAPLVAGLAGEDAAEAPRVAQRLAEATSALVIAPLLRLDYVTLVRPEPGWTGRPELPAAAPRFAIAAGSGVAYAARRRPRMPPESGLLQLAEPLASPERFATVAAGAGALVSMLPFATEIRTPVEAVQARWMAVARAAYRGFNAAVVEALRGGRTE
jgi:hypothetical protein